MRDHDCIFFSLSVRAGVGFAVTCTLSNFLALIASPQHIEIGMAIFLGPWPLIPYHASLPDL